MKTKTFIAKYSPCKAGKEFAEQYENMSEVWDNCQHTHWMFWILAHHAPLEQKQSITLAIKFAESCLANVTKGDDRPRLAIKAARKCLDDPSGENKSAADSAARSAARSAAWSAAWSAWSAAESTAESAAWSAESTARSAAWSAAWSAGSAARSAARSAAWSAAGSAAGSAQCDIIRETIANPFS